VLVLGALGLLLPGCGFRDLSGYGQEAATSSGGEAYADQSLEPVGALIYENWITFDRNIVIAVDHVLARLRSGDNDTKALVQEFVQPGIKLINDHLEVSLPKSEPTPVFEESQFVLKTDFSPWSYSTNFPNSIMMTVPVGTASGHTYRWRGMILDAIADFNSITPTKVHLRGTLVIDMQVRLAENTGWAEVKYYRQSLDNIADTLRTNLNRTYHRYLRDRYDVKIKSEWPGGPDEHQS
jgi:hypothetical protein